MTAALLVVVLGLIAAGCSGPSGKGGPSSTTQPAAPARVLAGPPDRVALIRDQHLPNVELITHEGRRVRFYDDLVKDKVVAINFMFTRCSRFCPITTPKLATVQAALGERAGRDVFMYSITLDPTNDTPDVLKRYAQDFGARPGWTFLTGKSEDIQMLRRKLGVYDRDPLIDADQTQHMGIIVLGNEPRGRWKAVAALSKAVRIRQAIERTILPPSQWPTGEAVVNEGPYEDDEQRVEPADLSDLPLAIGHASTKIGRPPVATNKLPAR